MDKKIKNFDQLPFQVQYLIKKAFDPAESEVVRQNYYTRLVDIQMAIEEVKQEKEMLETKPYQFNKRDNKKNKIKVI